MEKIKFLVIGDLHFRRGAGAEQNEKMCNDILTFVEQNAPSLSFVVLLGDTLHEHDMMRTPPFRKAVSFINDLAAHLHVYLLIGNHDVENNSINLCELEKRQKTHPFICWDGESRSNITVVDDLTFWEAKGHKFCALPYLPPGNYKKVLEKNNVDIYNTYSCFFSHQDWIGAKFSATSDPAHVGEKWPKKATLNVGGHIHRYQIIHEKLILVGTPAPHSFGEDNDKGITVFTIDENRDYTFTRHKLPNVAERITCEFKLGDKADLLAHVKKFSAMDREKYLLRTIVRGSATEIKNFLKTELSKKLKNLGQLKTEVTDEESVMAQIQTIGDDWRQLRSKSFAEIFLDHLTEEDKAYFSEIQPTLDKIFSA